MSNATPFGWKKSYMCRDFHSESSSANTSMNTNISSNESSSEISHISNTTLQHLNTNTKPIGIQKRRKSSMSSLYSPFTRRASFLSRTMIENESIQCYELSKYYSFHDKNKNNNNNNNNSIPSYSINLSESQGFLWNQDLFATSYQQSEAGVHLNMSMSDGSYCASHRYNRFSDIIDEGDTNNSLVDVIDVIVGNDDYNSDVELVTEFVKVNDNPYGDEYNEYYDDDNDHYHDEDYDMNPDYTEHARNHEISNTQLELHSGDDDIFDSDM